MTKTQALPLKQQLSTLVSLQEIDLKVNQLENEKNALPAQLKNLDISLKKIKSQMDAKQTQVNEFEKNHRQFKAAMELNADRMTRSSSKLDGVNNTNEFQAANKEIEQLKKMNAQLEEQNTKNNEALETCRKDFATVETEYKRIEGERKSLSDQISSKTAELDGKMGELFEERKKFLAGMPPQLLSQYDRVRKARAGIGIVPAVAGRCTGCNVMLPPQLFNEVQRCLEINFCPGCHRVLFVPVAGGTPASDARA